jgi:hypothetical protein
VFESVIRILGLRESNSGLKPIDKCLEEIWGFLLWLKKKVKKKRKKSFPAAAPPCSTGGRRAGIWVPWWQPAGRDEDHLLVLDKQEQHRERRESIPRERKWDLREERENLWKVSDLRWFWIYIYRQGSSVRVCITGLL